MSEWLQHADWWLGEVADDPIYESDVLPMAAELIGSPEGPVLELGCGEGQVMRALPFPVVGCDISLPLLRRAAEGGDVVNSRLPDLEWVRPGVVDTAYAVLVLEHLETLDVFAAVRRIVRPGGALVLVANHPAFTAPDAGPILDQVDGEFLWRWGSYFDAAQVAMPAGDSVVTFFHRPLEAILNSAAAAGWELERLVERGLSRAAIAAHPGYAGQEQMPRLLGVRWTTTQGSRHIGR